MLGVAQGPRRHSDDARAAPRPPLLAAHHQRDRSVAEGEVVERDWEDSPARPTDHTPSSVMAEEGLGGIPLPRRSRGARWRPLHPGHRRRQPGRAVGGVARRRLTPAHSALRGRTELARVGDAGGHQQEGRHALPARRTHRSSSGTGSIGRARARTPCSASVHSLRIQPLARHGLDGNAQLRRQLFDPVQLGRGIFGPPPGRI